MQKKTAHIQSKILLFDGFSNLCLANTIEPLRAANNVLGQACYEWDILSMTGGPVRSSSGLSIQPDGQYEGQSHGHRLFLISSYGYDRLYSPKLREYLRQHFYKGSEIYGLDTAAWLLAEAGCLNGKSATIHWDVLSRFEETFLEINVENRPYVRDQNLISCGGAMSAFDLMLSQISKDWGAEVRFDVESLFKRSHSVRFEKPDILSDLAITRKAIAIMHENLEVPLNITDLAVLLDCHPKALERAFKREMGLPTGRIYKRLRLNSIRDLVENTDAKLVDVAVRTGYKSASAMTRAFVSEFGYTPSEIRISLLSKAR